MDPYIEASGLWGDFHGSMVAVLRAQLNERLPAQYAAQLDLYVWVHEAPPRRKRRAIEPDVYVAAKSERSGRGRGAATLAPATIVLPEIKRHRQKYLKVVDVASRRVVTVIELLSPVNKQAGDGRAAYLQKRQEIIANHLNLVEIDLLRGGVKLPLGKKPPDRLEDYYVMVAPASDYPEAYFWSFGLRDVVPSIAVPLERDVPGVTVDLKACIDRVYREGRYGTDLDYSQPLTPRLDKADAGWVRDLIAKPSRKNGR
jgi:hypothetical protein